MNKKFDRPLSSFLISTEEMQNSIIIIRKQKCVTNEQIIIPDIFFFINI